MTGLGEWDVGIGAVALGSRGGSRQVSNWYDHPGGSVIFTHAGDDFTDIFAAFHPPSATDALDSFYIGKTCCARWRLSLMRCFCDGEVSL